MTPAEFLEDVAGPNARLALQDSGDLRLAINAIMTLDAFFGVLHAALREAGAVAAKRDDQWKDLLADESNEYRLLRDAAFALKHGKLDGRKARLVRRPDQLFAMPRGFDPRAFQSGAFQTGRVWIDTEATDYPADETIEKVLQVARERLDAYAAVLKF